MRKLDILKKAVVAVAVVVMGMAAVPAMAVDCPGGLDCITEGIKNTGMENTAGANNLPDVVKNIINVILYIIGVLSVAFIIYGGIKYSMSAGDAAKVKSAKDTLMYAIIGLIVAILAYAIVNFVITSFGN